MKKIVSLLLLSSGVLLAHTYTLSESGWHLLGATEKLSAMSPFNKGCVETLWRYKDGNWIRYQPNGIGNTLSSMDAGDGFWLKNSSS